MRRPKGSFTSSILIYSNRENIQDFDKYMILKDISENLKTRIYNFFELVWSV